MQPLEAALAQLSHLAQGKLPPQAYLLNLLGIDDELTQTASACRLLDAGLWPAGRDETLLDLCRHGAIRPRAFSFFLMQDNFSAARRAADIALIAKPPGTSHELDSRLRSDWRSVAEIQLSSFAETGQVNHLAEAAKSFDQAGDWKSASVLVALLTLLKPEDAGNCVWLFKLIERAASTVHLKLLSEALHKAAAFPVVQAMVDTRISLIERTSQFSVHTLDPARLPPAIQREIALQRAEIAELAGDFQEAYDWYCRQNIAGRGPKFDPQALLRRSSFRASITVAESGSGQGGPEVMLLGFPRSGTTLLENVLAAHPDIETFEEQPIFDRALRAANLDVAGSKTISADQVQAIRDRYHTIILNRATNPKAKVFIDKMPIRTADAPLLARLFPSMRHLFSIRHPHDVVLSCFKQPFQPNVAMDSFTTFADACRTYDAVMTRWFETFTLQSTNVRYVRYEELVTAFRPTVEGIFAFLGVPWHSSVEDFARKAESRHIKTPSRTKVRGGLAVGVQSSWANYRFLFDSADAKPLSKWVKFFDYD
jgi:hypothetical protein